MQSTSSSTTSGNTSLTPIPTQERIFGLNNHLSLWFSLGVGLLVMQMGADLVPSLGTELAIWAIIAGSIIGSALLAFVARLGAISGLSSAALINHTYGKSFAVLPVIMNVIQLIGWGTFEIIILRDSTTTIIKHSSGVDLSSGWGAAAITLVWGLILLGLMAASMLTVVRKFVSHIGLPLVVLALIWVSYKLISGSHDLGLAWNKPGDGKTSFFYGFDLVIAMPVSWLPLVADYARYGKKVSSTFNGTFFGYVLANIWCYGLGVFLVSTAPDQTDMQGALLLMQGGIIAMSFILIDELDNAYGDLYSGSVSLHSIGSRISRRTWGLSLAVICTLIAVALPIEKLEDFLLLLSSVFIPLYGVILGSLSSKYLKANAYVNDRIYWKPAIIWILGIIIFHAVAQWAPQVGSTFPSLIFCFIASFLFARKSS